MKRFIVFAYDEYYPGGGWNDFVTTVDEFDAADQEARRQLASEAGTKDYAHIVDTVTGRVWEYA
ncbi:BcepNY3gp63 [Burkholderia phage BcepNY3]|uniref:BcepNY3gp63 n=1 Tax=Burkholderia phage BcepNY3 TaxID=2881397 RepID=A6N3H1_9CAUD|nr:BcepNY3gp63 [Burkholderia phage BcepNY3]ABR10598.1 BcepNY3gp63 [Burkholderia phage BcepNY3]